MGKKIEAIDTGIKLFGGLCLFYALFISPKIGYDIYKQNELEKSLEKNGAIMMDINQNGKLDIISKKGIYLHKSEWNYEKVNNLNKFFRKEFKNVSSK